MTGSRDRGYHFEEFGLNESHRYLLPTVLDILGSIPASAGMKLFELGCGDGSIAWELTQRGWEVVGVDPSVEGIERAHESYPGIRIDRGSAYDDLVSRYGRFEVLLSLEVVEHVYAPRRYARTAFELLKPGGIAILSTPYHGYWKNLGLAITGRMDSHFTALWDHGHIKFWSIKTLSALLSEAGFVEVEFRRVGRIAPLAKAMVAVARKP
jgi:2-polyprenyl-6-hydroxyphenyl methylase/3-demethylubiquinone-9 3-methyltransferase